jgi:hypothetical protein
MVVMGTCMSTGGAESEQRKRSNKIDKELEEDSKKLRKECKILLLGMSPPPAGCGTFWLPCGTSDVGYANGAQAPARAESRQS